MTRNRNEAVDHGFLAGGGELGALMRAKDWSSSPLGPPEAWPDALKLIVGVVLANRFPMLLWWGPEYVSIYNDAYRPVLGAKHPWALGLPFREVWPEVAHVLEPLIDTPFNGGPSSWTDDILLEINRHGFLEETHFNFAYSPVPDTTAPRGIGGVLATVSELTGKVVGERRIAALRAVGGDIGVMRSVDEVCTNMAAQLEAYALDLPFALIYLAEPGAARATLAAAAGVAKGAPAAPPTIDSRSPRSGATWPLGEVARSQRALVVDALGERFETLPQGPWSDRPERAVVLPLRTAGTDTTAGFLVAGVSARLPLDAAYLTFLELVAKQIAGGIATARAYEVERKRAEALAEIDRAKTVFFSNVSHEFRTPLTLLLGPIEDLLRADREPDPAAQRASLELAHRNGLRLLKLVNTLLDFSRIEAGRADAVYEPTDVAALTSELASNFQSLTDRAALGLHVDAGAPVMAVVDREMWEKVVLNLVSNAFKFTLHGRIDVRVRGEGERIVLEVADTGAGIPAADLPHVFERFRRVAGAKGRSFEGSGIGLALVYELVRLHGGAITVESEEGRGSTFRVVIPSGSAHLPAERVHAARASVSTAIRPLAFVEEALRWLAPEAPAIARAVKTSIRDYSPAARRRRVLVVDDNADMREYIARLLSPHHEVVLAADGGHALEIIEEGAPDLIVADVMMPRVDGFDLLEAVHGQPRLRDIPVILLSARAGEEARVEGISAGADEYLTKPFSPEELVARVDNNLHLIELRRKTTAALRASEERLRALVNASSDVVYSMSPDWTEMRRLDGRGFLADKQEPGVRWIDEYILPEDQPEVLGAIDRAISGQRVFELEHRVRRIDGSVGWTQSRAIPIFVGEHIVEWFGMASDVTERREAENHRRLLLNELNHRVKNTLAIVQSLVRQSLKDVEGSKDARELLDARLVALAQAHDTLTREHWEGAPIESVVEDALRPLRPGRARISIEGPTVSLSPRQVIALSMALHELGTNALKHGALSAASGRVRLCWKLEAGRDLVIEWIEAGGPRVEPPRHRGFGLRLLERSLGQDLGGAVTLDFAPDGVHCTIRAALEKRQALSATDIARGAERHG